MEKARELTVKIFKLLMKPEMRILPGHLAFFLVMTLIPLVALLITIAAALSISTDTLHLAISKSIPQEAAAILNGIVTGDGINFNIIVFYFASFLLASNGTYSMINTSNEIYKIKPKDIITRRLKAILMIFILIGLFLFLILVPVFGSTVFDIIKSLTNGGNVTKIIQSVLVLFKYPIILLILFINIKLMYIIAPDSDIPSKSTNLGAVFTSIGWILATEIFSFYIEKFGQYDLFYGSISNMLVLLLWIYLLAYIYVFGMIINASEYKEEK